MPRDAELRTVLVIGSGPIVIGQAAEFDYAGTQACRALREEGLRVVLVNSNPATIMTDPQTADRVYIEPLDVESVTNIIRIERPEGLLPTLGGQVGLNLAVELAECGALTRHGVRLLGTPLQAIKRAEDRELFKQTMTDIGEPIPPSAIARSVAEALELARVLEYPVIVRPAYTLGGSGGGMAADPESLAEICQRGLILSMIHQVLLEKSVAGWKEIEYEVIRDRAGNCITICNMENLDPIGIHTGDSIVVAPSQTLSDREYQSLRTASIRIISALQIEGGCNIQFALDPASSAYYVIEVNPRVSRSSALASKATGFPIAKVAAKIAAGLRLDEIPNPVTGKTWACFEPALDYVVVKVPRWPFDKFAGAARRLGTQMKATGEVMAIERSFEAALQKALRSLDIGLNGLAAPGVSRLSATEVKRKIEAGDDERLLAIAEALRRGFTEEEISTWTAIDVWFLSKIARIVRMEQRLAGLGVDCLNAADWRTAKQLGFSDRRLGTLWNLDEDEVRRKRLALGIAPAYKMVDTCAGEFEAETPYYYSCYEQENEAVPSGKPKVLVLGSGPIRIGQGIEFDCCSVHAVWALREAGYETIIINNNPETVSTDFDTSDRLYFEPLTKEDVLNVVDLEQPIGVMVQFGGQTAINMAGPLAEHGVAIMGTPVEAIDLTEDRDQFERLLARLDVKRPAGGSATSTAGALKVARSVGYPVVVRPSYVLGGRAMQIVYGDEDLEEYTARAVTVTPDRPVLVDKYVGGREIEVDAVADGEGNVLIPGIMEHIERAGIHSGDSVAIYPPLNLPPEVKQEVYRISSLLARSVGAIGLLNIQFVLHNGEVLVLEVNPRASRTVPFLTKITGVPIVRLAVGAVLGRTISGMGYSAGLWPETAVFGVKAPVFSFGKLTDVEISLGPEMKSTGEVMGISASPWKAVHKALAAAGTRVPGRGSLLATIADKDKPEGVPILAGYARLGWSIFATAGTAAALRDAGVSATGVAKIREGRPNLLSLIQGRQVDLVINTLTRGRDPQRDGFRIRRAAVEHNVVCLTSLDTVAALLRAIGERTENGEPEVRALQDLHGGKAPAAGPQPGRAFPHDASKTPGARPAAGDWL
jgi:carbamoyl-phosphate synthase large subunit